MRINIGRERDLKKIYQNGWFRDKFYIDSIMLL